jgi:hypothetical protein
MTQTHGDLRPTANTTSRSCQATEVEAKAKPISHARRPLLGLTEDAITVPEKDLRPSKAPKIIRGEENMADLMREHAEKASWVAMLQDALA